MTQQMALFLCDQIGSEQNLFSVMAVPIDEPFQETSQSGDSVIYSSHLAALERTATSKDSMAN